MTCQNHSWVPFKYSNSFKVSLFQNYILQVVFRSLHKLGPPRLSTSTFSSSLCSIIPSARLGKMPSPSMSISCSFLNLRCLLFCFVLISVFPVTHHTHDLLTLILRFQTIESPFGFWGDLQRCITAVAVVVRLRNTYLTDINSVIL